jgi:hypothetical protein
MAAPDAAVTLSVLKALQAEIDAALERIKSRLPDEAKPSVDLVETLVNSALDGLNLTTLRGAIAAELVGLLTTGQSAAPHDPTENA